MHIQLDDIKRLTTLAYAAALAPEKWQLVIEALTEVSGARTHLLGYDADAGLALVAGYSGYDPDFTATYDEYFHQKNVWAEGFIEADVGVPVHSEWMCSREDLYKSEFYSDWIRPQEDIVGGGGALLFKEDQRMFAFGGNLRRPDVDRLERPWLELVGEVIPHFQQAFEISRMLAGLSLEKQALTLGEVSGDAACIVINSHHRIIYANGTASDLLESGDLIRRGLSSQLVFTDWKSNTIFNTALAAVEHSETRRPQSLELQADADDPALMVRIAHIEPERLDYSTFPILLGYSERCFLIVVSRQPENEAVADRLSARYSLTPQELNVVLRIVEGQTTSEIAEIREVSIHTVRNQLKSAMSKMDARRQSDLVRIVVQMSIY